MPLDNEGHQLALKNIDDSYVLYTTWNYTDNFTMAECKQRFLTHLKEMSVVLVNDNVVNAPIYKPTFMGRGFIEKENEIFKALQEVCTGKEGQSLVNLGFTINKNDFLFEQLPDFLETYKPRPDFKIVGKEKSDIEKLQKIEKKTINTDLQANSPIKAKKMWKKFLTIMVIFILWKLFSPELLDYLNKNYS